MGGLPHTLCIVHIWTIHRVWGGPPYTIRILSASGIVFVPSLLKFLTCWSSYMCELPTLLNFPPCWSSYLVEDSLFVSFSRCVFFSQYISFSQFIPNIPIFLLFCQFSTNIPIFLFFVNSIWSPSVLTWATIFRTWPPKLTKLATICRNDPQTN